MLSKIENDPNLTIVRLYSRTWKLNQSKEKTELFKEFILNSDGLIQLGCFIEKNLPVCDEIAELLAIVDVKKCLSLEEKINKI